MRKTILSAFASLLIMFFIQCSDTHTTTTGAGVTSNDRFADAWNQVNTNNQYFTWNDPTLDISNILSAFDFQNTYSGVVGSYTPAQIQAYINYVAPDNSTAINFYNSWSSVVAGLTTAQVNTDISFHTTWSSVVGVNTPAQITTDINFYSNWNSTVAGNTPAQITTDINFYSNWNSTVAGKTPAQVTAALNYVAPDDSTQINFYNNYASIIGSKTPAQVTSALNFTNSVTVTPIVFTPNSAHGCLANINLTGADVSNISVMPISTGVKSYMNGTIVWSNPYCILMWNTVDMTGVQVIISGTYILNNVVHSVPAVIVTL
jgi:hypothetical protein